MSNNLGVQLLIRDLLPPVLYRALRQIRRASRKPIVGQERDASWYDQTFLDYGHYRVHYTESPYYPLWTVIVDRMLRAEVNTLLDLGCGPGQFALMMHDRGIPHYVGLDFSGEQIAYAQQLCPDYEFVQADILVLENWRDRQFDTILSTEFLEHVERDLYVIENMPPGIRFYGSVPNFPAEGHVRYFSTVDEVRERYGSYFDDFRVDKILRRETGNGFFLMEGVKR